MKRMWLSVGLMALCTVNLAQAKVSQCRPEPPTPVQSDDFTWHVTGHMIGTRSTLSSGFFDSDDLGFSLGGEIRPGSNRYPSKRMILSTRRSTIADKLEDTPSSQVIILKYGRAYVEPQFTSSNHILLALKNPDSDFDSTESGQLFGREFLESCDIGRGRARAKAILSGVIVGTQRYGVRSKSCTVFLHNGGMREKIEYEHIRKTKLVKNKETGEIEEVEDWKTKKHRSLVPNIVKLTAFSDEACDYAENVMSAQLEVDIELSTQAIWGILYQSPHKVHRITITDKPSALEQTDKQQVDVGGSSL
ncbi:hypothetical protein [Parendozoicomonas haliclonae]|uniref:Uncharacterized protein n=1 Tax=Parendozoicomonas haliclonae TaxID=1960125 RepID=A0A1X7AG61_9GAMM|nr:hypothetical protein [Parendozoicomonas haliclonae]SMA37437.1 hypothetical protein EHSB41UT_00738 [Parendozoicomonas haliclonae]